MVLSNFAVIYILQYISQFEYSIDDSWPLLYDHSALQMHLYYKFSVIVFSNMSAHVRQVFNSNMYRKRGKIRWAKLSRFLWFSGSPRKFPVNI